jgi:peptidyl-prolyl cis-trans isomerase D
VQKEYDDKAEQLAHPEQRDILQVVLPDEEKAKQLVKQARASGDLAAAATAEKENAIPLNQLDDKSLMPELAKTVFALHPGEIGEPVKTQLGWHVVQLKKITPASRLLPKSKTSCAKICVTIRRLKKQRASSINWTTNWRQDIRWTMWRTG